MGVETGSKSESKKRPQAFLYFVRGVNDEITEAVREKLREQGVPFIETDLTEIDNDWPGKPPYIHGPVSAGNFQSPEDVKTFISVAFPSRQSTDRVKINLIPEETPTDKAIKSVVKQITRGTSEANKKKFEKIIFRNSQKPKE